MNYKWWKSIFLLPLIGCTLYAGGYIAQFIRNYQFWEKSGHFAGDGTNPQFPSLAPLECFKALTDFPYKCMVYSVALQPLHYSPSC